MICSNKNLRPVPCAPAYWGLLLAVLSLPVLPALVAPAGPPEDEETPKTVEFRVNGEAVTRESLIEGIEEANACAPEVCPTEFSAAIEKRRARLIQLIPLRQFLEKEKITVPEPEIEARITEMKNSPDPFRRYPPKPLKQVMVRECMSWSDLRLMIHVDLGMNRWAEKKWREKWPTTDAWNEYCRDQTTAFHERFGKFRRLSFSISQWPKGAADEKEALALLRQKAEKARERLHKGETFDAVAAATLPKTGPEADAVAPAIWPHHFLGRDNADVLSAMNAGDISNPLPTPFGWEIVKKLAPSTDEIADVLKSGFLQTVQREAQQEVAEQTRLEKVNWWQERLFEDRSSAFE